MFTAAAVAATFTGVLRADLTVYTEKVDGWIWQYEIAEGKAQNVIGSFTSKYTEPSPHLVIPAKLGGKAVASLVTRFYGEGELNGKTDAELEKLMKD